MRNKEFAAKTAGLVMGLTLVSGANINSAEAMQVQPKDPSVSATKGYQIEALGKDLISVDAESTGDWDAPDQLKKGVREVAEKCSIKSITVVDFSGYIRNTAYIVVEDSNCLTTQKKPINIITVKAS